MGGSKKVEDQTSDKLPPIMQVLRHGLLNMTMHNQEGAQEDGQNDDESEINFIPNFPDFRILSD